MIKYMEKDSRLHGMRKKFDKDMHDKYDIPARNALKEVLGDYISDHPDDKAQDMVINSKTCRYKYLEVQVISDWIETFPHDNMFVYERKGRYGDDTLFITLNRPCTLGYIFDRKTFADKPRRIKKWSREFIYDIPLNRCMLVGISTLDELTFELL